MNLKEWKPKNWCPLRIPILRFLLCIYACWHWSNSLLPRTLEAGIPPLHVCYMGSSSAFMPNGTVQIPRRPEHWKGEFPPPVSSSNAFKRNPGPNTIGRGKRGFKWRLGSTGLTTDVKNHLGFEDHGIRTRTHWGLLVLSGNIGSLFFNHQDLTYGKWRCNSSVGGDCIIHNPKKGMVVLKNPHPPPLSVRICNFWGYITSPWQPNMVWLCPFGLHKECE